VYRLSKRAVDVFGSALILIVMTPIWIAVVVAIRMSSGRPVFYQARRMGTHGQEFIMLKFRTMNPSVAGPGVTGSSDARITRIGHILRRWKLDELPQLINVMRGEMSLVGPRPEDPRYLPFYSTADRAALSVIPGVTGLTQLRYRHEERLLRGPHVEEQYRQWLLPRKLNLDCEYVRRRSLVLDFKIMFLTVLIVAGLKSWENGEEELGNMRETERLSDRR
jgi:lipopolysaccharide/colanic/teichoic acid biosynthesis glycosyltransferase